MSFEQRVHDLGLVLPAVPTPSGSYIPARQYGNLIYLAGQGPLHADGHKDLGKVGVDVSVDEARKSARQSALVHLAVLRQALGSLDRVRGIIKVLGMVNAAPDFTRHPDVINGYSDLMVEVFGEAGRHARSAVGMASLPFNMSVEVETIVEIA